MSTSGRSNEIFGSVRITSIYIFKLIFCWIDLIVVLVEMGDLNLIPVGLCACTKSHTIYIQFANTNEKLSAVDGFGILNQCLYGYLEFKTEHFSIIVSQQPPLLKSSHQKGCLNPRHFFRRGHENQN